MQEDEQSDKILIIGLHSTPAFAVIDELKLKGFKNIIWVSEKYNQKGNKNTSAEFNTVTKIYKIPFINIITGKLIKELSFYSFTQILKLVFGFIHSFFILLKHRPSIIVSFGSYISVPLIFIGKLLKIPILIHEQTLSIGLATRLTEKYANIVCITWEETASLIKNKNIKITGNPIRKDIFAINSSIKEKLNPKIPTIYVTGGNQGAHEINKLIFPILTDLLPKYNVIHQTGNSTVTEDYKKAQFFEVEFQSKFQGTYISKEYVNKDEIGEVFNLSNLVISRSGVNTTLEFMVLGKVSLLIPLPNINYSEQEKNADKLSEIGIGKKLIQDKNLTRKVLLNEIETAFSLMESGLAFNGQPLKKVIESSKNNVILNSAESVSDEIIKIGK